MKGSMIQDVTVMVGTIILIFIIIYWVSAYGAEIVGDLLYSSPDIVQGSFSSFLSIAETESRNISIVYELEKDIPFEISIDENIVNVKQLEKKMYSFTERGGYVYFGTPKPLNYINCMYTDMALPYEKEFSKKLEIEKKGNKIKIGAE